MRRFLLLLVAALLTAPAVAEAQISPKHLPADQELPRFAVTPFAGVQAPYMAAGRFGLVFPDGGREFWDVTQVFEPALAAGLQLQTHIGGPWGALASISYSYGADQSVRYDAWALDGAHTGDEVVEFRTGGQALWMGRMAVYYRLPVPERDLRLYPVIGTVSAGPAVVRQEGRDYLGTGEGLADPVYNLAINVGADAILPIAALPGVSLYAGAENYLTFWNTGEWERREAAFYWPGTTVQYDYNPTFLVLFRIGSTVRF